MAAPIPTPGPASTATLTAPDSTPLMYTAYEAPTPHAAILLLHGWFDHAGRWSEAGERLRSAGYSVYLLDQRGHGRSGGRRGHLSRFSQLLGDLQAFRRAVRSRSPNLPQVLLGHSFGGLVALRYLETQPSDPIAAAVMSCPWLGLASPPAAWKLALSRLLADLWPTVPIPARIDAAWVSRDPAVNAAYEADPQVHGVMTPGAWREIQWAQRAVPADSHRIDAPLLFLLAGEDRIVDAHGARAFADSLRGGAEVRWYGEMFHEILHDPQREQVFTDILAFLAERGLG
jgi:alpha-beta hydrolase superfamily lysophospholipase